MPSVRRWSSAVRSASSRSSSDFVGDGGVEFCDTSLKLFVRHFRQTMLDLDLFRQQFSREFQPNVRHLLAHLGEHGLAVLLELAAERVNVVLIDLVAGAFRAAGIMRITATPHP